MLKVNELHTAMPRPACPGSSSVTDPHHKVQAKPPRFASRLLCELVSDTVGTRTPNPSAETPALKDYAITIDNKWTQFVASDDTFPSPMEAHDVCGAVPASHRVV